MITASACRVLGWVHAKNARPESSSAHDFGSAPDTPDLAGIASRKDSQGARTAGQDGWQGDGKKGIGVLPADRSHAQNQERGQAAQRFRIGLSSTRRKRDS